MSDVLVIIDVQNAILEEAAPPTRVSSVNRHFESMVARLVDLKVRVAKTGIPTILIQNDGPEGHRLETGSQGWDIVPDLRTNPNDIVIRKTACDSFYETDLLDQLTALAATRLIVGGCMTQFCVDTTVRRAVTLGFDVILLADGHCTGDAGDLRQDQIIAHHNRTLIDVGTGSNSVTLSNTADYDAGRMKADE